MSTDPLTEICSAVEVRDAVFTRVVATAPWGLKSPGVAGIKFALLLRGTAVLMTDAHAKPISLRAGDMFLTLGALPYEVYDAPGSDLLDCAEVLSTQVGDTISVGGGGVVASFLSGEFRIADQTLPLLSALPNFLLLTGDSERSSAIEAVLRMLALETATWRMGSEAMVRRLFEMLFIYAIRDHADGDGPRRGWLAALSDPKIGRAARALHEDLAQDWTLEALARRSGMSRSAFAVRFREITAQTPLDYLTSWRVHSAARLIAEGGQSFAEIAETVGYRSEAAFNRIFKRKTGRTPGQFRKEKRQMAPIERKNAVAA